LVRIGRHQRDRSKRGHPRFKVEMRKKATHIRVTEQKGEAGYVQMTLTARADTQKGEGENFKVSQQVIRKKKR